MLTPFQPRPYTIEAARLTKENHRELSELCGGQPFGGPPTRAQESITINVGTGEEQKAKLGDWIAKLTTDEGEVVWDVIDHPSFHATYTPFIFESITRAAEERRRQLGIGFDAFHDDALANGTLAQAGLAYGHLARRQLFMSDFKEDLDREPTGWPWPQGVWNPSPDPKRNLVVAIALLAAELDRAIRLDNKTQPTLPSNE